MHVLSVNWPYERDVITINVCVKEVVMHFWQYSVCPTAIYNKQQNQDPTFHIVYSFH